MPIRKLSMLPLAASFFLYTSLQSMVYDNRFMPLYARAYPRRTGMQSNFMGNGFFMVGNDAFQDTSENFGIPEMFGQVTTRQSQRGKFDQIKMRNALEELGIPFTPIPMSLNQEGEILWNLKGKIQTQGVALQFDNYIKHNVSVGLTCFFMHLFSRQEFILDANLDSQLQSGDKRELDVSRRSMLDAAGVQAVKISEIGFSDIDAYVRVGDVWDYPYKFRRVDIGGRLGVMVPTGKKQSLKNPASIPFGGNGFWGIYGAIDAEFELKEDLNVGLLFRLNHRFERNTKRRLPIEREDQLYAPLIDNIDVAPGLTAIFAPYIRMDALRQGLGIEIKYTVVAHEDDSFCDTRAVKQPVLTLTDVRKTSDWNSEYLTFTAAYDFAYDRVKCDWIPYFYFMWDMPVSFFFAKSVAKTNRASIGVEIHY